MARKQRPEVRQLVRSGPADQPRPRSGAGDQGVSTEMTETAAIEASFVAEARSKALGAYYTEQPVARFLLDWTTSCASDTVLDPSFGGGVFLQAAFERVRALGGQTAQVCGI